MIVIRIFGGLGDQIAMYAFGLRCARMLGVPLKLDFSELVESGSQPLLFDYFQLKAECASDVDVANAKLFCHIRETVKYYCDELINQICDGCYLDGQWRDIRYSQSVIHELSESLVLKIPINPLWGDLYKVIGTQNSISIHIDYQDSHQSSENFELPLSYYEDAINSASAILEKPHFFLFSNNLIKAKNQIALSVDHTWVEIDEQTNPVAMFEMMRACQHHINSNHSMSTWSALLGKREGTNWIPQQYYKVGSTGESNAREEVRQPAWPHDWVALPTRSERSRTVDYADLPGGDCSHKPICVAVTGLYESLVTQGFLFKQNNTSLGADLLKPWVELSRYGLKHGIRFVTPDELDKIEDADAVMILDRPDPQNIWAQRLMERPIVKYLVISESLVIRPQNWDEAYHEQFDRIFTWADDWVDNVKYIKFNMAIEASPVLDFSVAKSAFAQRKLVTMIAGGKIANHPNELYSKRIQGIQWFEANAPLHFDLYGQGWPQGYFSTYRGPVDDKLLTLGRYRFCICFENAKGYPGYITEKILDCFLAGVVPIYWGASNITDWIPRTCFIDFQQFTSWDQLYEYLQSMSSDSYNRFLDAIASFLMSPSIYPFTIDSFISSVTGHLARDTKKQFGQRPRLSVVIPTFNHGKYIETAISSVLSQNIENIELLVIDNASTDDTKDKVKPFLKNPSVRYMRQERNVGGPNNWATGANLACGEALTLLSSDDFFLEGHLHRALSALESSPQAGLVYCPVICVDENDKPIKVLAHPGHPTVDYCGGRNEVLDLLSMDCYITPSAAVIRFDTFEKAGGLNIKIRAAIDWDMWIRIAKSGVDFLFYRLPSVCYRLHGEQDTSRATKAGDMLRDHVDILSHHIQRSGIDSLLERKDRIIQLLRWRMMYQAGACGPDTFAKADELIQILLEAKPSEVM